MSIRCGARSTEGLQRGYAHACMKPHGHDGMHECPYSEPPFQWVEVAA